MIGVCTRVHPSNVKCMRACLSLPRHVSWQILRSLRLPQNDSIFTLKILRSLKDNNSWWQSLPFATLIRQGKWLRIV